MMMKAWLLEKHAPVEQAPLKLREVPVPAPKNDELLLEVTACGVCHTDLHTVEGEIRPDRLPVIIGHQVVGRVVENGASASRFKIGERAGVPWLHRTCGSCRHCAAGLENLCESGRFTGFHVNGGYAQYMTAPEDFAYRIPDAFDDLHAAPLLCAGIIGYRALRLSGIKPGGRLGLFGFGASAHLAIQIAASEGADVYVFSRSEDHRRHAMELGAAWTGRADETPPEPLTAAISFAPAGSLVPVALEKLEKGATLALAGIYVDKIPPLDYEKHLFHEKILRSVTASTREDARELLKAAAAVPVKTDIEVFGFEQANELLVRLKESRVKGAAVLDIMGAG